MADNKVNFLRGTSAEYEAATKDNDTFYYTADDEKLYLGDKEITGGGVTIDDTLSDTSKNPVQNKVVNAALNSKADLTDIPTELPANGGNADTVDGKHASDFTLSYIRNNKPLVTSILALETTARLKWLPVDGATKYAVSLYIDGKYVQQSTSITNTYYDIQGLTPGTVYLALVQAYVNGSWSKFTTDDLVHFYTLPVASDTSDGLVTRSSQTFAGLKTFNNGIRSNVGVPLYISGSLKYPNAIHTNSGSADKDGFIIFGDNGAELQVKGTNIWRQATSISNRPELRNLASGTASANTTNCPSGAWYGKHS